MRVGIDQLHISPLRLSGSVLPSPGIQLIDRARLYGLNTLSGIKVRHTTKDNYEILSGLITWRVAQVLRIDNIDVECIEPADAAARDMVRDDLEQSKALDPITQAEILRAQIHTHGSSRKTLCERYTLSSSQLSHLLRLLTLDTQVRNHVREGRLSVGSAKMLVGLTPNNQRLIAQSSIDNSLSTRQVEGLARNTKSKQVPPRPVNDYGSNIRKLEETLSEQLGNPVIIKWDHSQRSGELAIKYFGLEELQTIIGKLQNGAETE